MPPLPLFPAHSLKFCFQLLLLQFQICYGFASSSTFHTCFHISRCTCSESHSTSFTSVASIELPTGSTRDFFLHCIFYSCFYILPHKHLFSHKNMAIRLSLRITTQLQIYFFLTNSNFTPSVNENPPSKIKEIHIAFQYGA